MISKPAPAAPVSPVPPRDLAPIPLLRLDAAEPELFADLMNAVEGIAARAAFTLGEEVVAFEDDFARFCGTPHAIGVSSGTEALVLSLRALEIGPGDEVLVPTNSFIATAEAVTLAGAIPRLIDVDASTGLITAEILAAAIGPKTRGAIPVHLHGATVDMAAVMEVARKTSIAIVEDACQAHGARLPGGGRAGSAGDAGCFSFYPTKNLGGWGDGGGIVTSSDALADHVRLLRSHGESPDERHRHRLCGTTARLDGLQASVLRIKLERLEGWNAARRRLAARLSSALEHSTVTTPECPPGGDHVFHVYAIETERREALREHLARHGVATAIHYPTPIHLTEAYAHLGQGRGSLPEAERRATRICSLPMFPSLTPLEVDRVSTAVLTFE